MSQGPMSWNGPRRPAPGASRPVTQAMLAEYVALSAQVKRHQRLREQLLVLLSAGCGVEPGPLAARAWTSKSRRLSAAKLAAVAGAALAEVYLSRIESSEVRHLDVSEVQPAGGVPISQGLSPAGGRSPAGTGPGSGLQLPRHGGR